MQQDGGMLQVGSFCEPLFPEEVPIVELENAQYIWVPTVTSVEYNGPVKARVNFSQEFENP